MSLPSFDGAATRAFKYESTSAGTLIWLAALVAGLIKLGRQSAGQDMVSYVAGLGLLTLYPVLFLLAGLFLPISVALGHGGVKRVMRLMAFGAATLIALLPVFAVLNGQAVLDKLGIQSIPWVTLGLTGHSFGDVLAVYTIIVTVAAFVIRALSLRGSTHAIHAGLSEEMLQTRVKQDHTIRGMLFTPRLVIRLTKAFGRVTAGLFARVIAKRPKAQAAESVRPTFVSAHPDFSVSLPVPPEYPAAPRTPSGDVEPVVFDGELVPDVVEVPKSQVAPTGYLS